MTSTKVSMNQKIRSLVDRKLEQVVSKNADGLAVYAEGWSDDAIREFVEKELNTKVKPSTVNYMRKVLYGRLQNPNPVVKDAHGEAIKKLEARVKKLEDALLQAEMNSTAPLFKLIK